MKKQLSYIDSVHRSGTIWNISVMILLLAFPLTVAALFGAAPDWGALVVGLIATAPMYWAVGVIETVTFVPMLGAGGSYLSFVTGNISNLKLPCAINALEQNNVSANSEEGEIISTIAIATSSMATEMIKGKPIEEALKLSNKAVAEALDGLPPVKMHCSVLAEEAVRAAVKDYYDRNGIAYDPELFSKKLHDCEHCAE